MTRTARLKNRWRGSDRPRRILFEQLEDRSLLAAMITVNSPLDLDLRDSQLTLREAILINNRTLLVSNLTTGERAQVVGTPTNTDTDTIAFNIPGTGVWTISPETGLPTITEPVIVDGYTQPGAVPNSDPTGFNGTLLIELSGANAGPVNGLTIAGGGSTVRGLVINQFQAIGFLVGNGIYVTSSNNVIEGNILGSNATGTSKLGNERGLYVHSTNNLVGGSAPGARNVISGNDSVGLYVNSSNNQVRGNFIGTNAAGDSVLGNAVAGIFFAGSGNTIGGAAAGEGNVIGGNGTGISGNTFLANATIQGNFIGTDFTGTARLGNVYGVSITGSNVTIGGTSPGTGNTIAFNQGNVSVGRTSTAFDVRILGNSMFGSEVMGIDLGCCGETPNDEGDGDTGANRQQNFPELHSAEIDGNALSMEYRVASTAANATYPFRIEFFKADASGREGQTFLGFDTYTAAQASTSKTITFAPMAAISAGDTIVATATDGGGNTSEFSVGVAVEASGCSLVVTNTTDNGPGSLREAILCANSTPNIDRDGSPGVDPDRITFSIPGSGVQTISPTTALPTVTDPAIIDGYTQPGARPNTLAIGNDAVLLIELNGSGTPEGTDGLTITAGGSTVRGLVINRFPSFFQGHAIVLNTVGSNTVSGNFLGTDPTGTLDRGNMGSGVMISGGTANTVGGPQPADRNVVSANSGEAIHINGGSNHTVVGNYVGTDRSGQQPLGNGVGIYIEAAGNRIGGTEAGAGNVISGNRQGGLTVFNSNARNNMVQGNIIGLGADGSTLVPNATQKVTPDGFSGLFLGGGASDNLIGGTTAGSRNIISGNAYAGITARSTFNASQPNRIQGNYIGTDITGTLARGNSGAGVHLFASNLPIGGSAAGEGNVISFNGGAGVLVVPQEGVVATGNAILGNRMHSNAGLGIDLAGDGLTANDATDADTGPNNRQNFPEISSASLNGNTLRLQYAVPSTTFNSASPLRVEFFKADANGQEGQIFFGADTYQAFDAGAVKEFLISPATIIAAGERIIATATDNEGNTSEFSASIVVEGAGCSIVVTNTNDSGPGSFREAINCANGTPGADNITFDGAIFSDASLDVIKLTGGELVIGSDLTIQGPGTSLLKLSGNNTSRVLRVTAGATATVTGLTIADGKGVGGGAIGGGIYNEGALTLHRVVVSGNSTQGGLGVIPGGGGGIQNVSGTLTLVHSTVDNNFAHGTGGGIDNQGGSVTLVGSTVSNNSCAEGAGGIGNFKGGSLTIHNSTISGNFSGLFGGGIATSSGTLIVTNSTITGNGSYDARGGITMFQSVTTLRNSIVAGNYKRGAPGSNASDLENGEVDTAENNLIGDAGTSGNIVHDADGNPATGGNNIVGNNGSGTIPLNTIIGALADNGGPTKTHDLVVDSPAINRGSNTLAVDAQNQPLTTDQRGANFPRIVNGVVDIGAFEFTPVNDPPSGTDRTVSLLEDATYTLVAPDFGFTDPLDGPPNAFAAVRIASPPAAGILTHYGAPVVTGQIILSTSLDEGALRYTPPGNANGTALSSFTFQVQDNGGTANGGADLDLSPNTIKFDLTGINDPPSGSDETITLHEDTRYTFQLSDFEFADPSDSPANNLKAVKIATVPIAGSLSVDGITAVQAGSFVSVASIISGHFTYTSAEDSEGGALSRFTFQVQDDGGTANGGSDIDPLPKAFIFDMTPANDAPRPANDVADVAENGVLDVAAVDGVLVNDFEVDTGDTKTVAAVNGLAANLGQPVTLGSGARVRMMGDGSYRYEPNGKFEGLGAGQMATDSFTYEVEDGAGARGTGMVTITVMGENDAPVAGDDGFGTEENTARVISRGEYLANDSDVDSSVLTAAIVTQPGHGSVSLRLDESFVYTPAADFSGEDRFTYRVSDGLAESDVATVSITVAAVNDSPVVTVGGNVAVAEGSVLVVNGSFADDDEGDSWIATVDYGDGGGPQPLALLANKTFQLGHGYADEGMHEVTVSVRDSTNRVGAASFRVFVHNAAPRELTWNGPGMVTRGQVAVFAGGFFDPGANDTHEARIDWGDGKTSAAEVARVGASFEVRASHVYGAGGVYQVALTVADDDGGATTISSTVLIVGARINRGVFELVGSAQRDNLKLVLVKKTLVVSGTLGNARINQAFPYTGVQQIVANLGGGNDSLTVDAKIKVPVLIDAGAGKDTVKAGGGAAVLIGGVGQDQLSGAGRSDLLIAGATAYDNNHAALRAILAEWGSARSLAVRSENLRSGGGAVLAGLNIALKPNETVFDDSSVDSLLGGGDLDWFLMDVKKDRAKDKAELVN